MDEKGSRAIVGCSWLAIFIQGKKRETQNKNQKKKKKKKKSEKGETLFKFAKNRNGCKRDENLITSSQGQLWVVH
jgi:hypothetical protein